MTSEKLSQNEIAEILADITSLIPELTENEKSFINRSISVFNRSGRVNVPSMVFREPRNAFKPI